MSEIIGYFQSGKSPKITDFNGNILSDEVKIISYKKLPRTSFLSDGILYIRFRYKDKIWSGTTPGGNMYVKARPTKLKRL